MKIVEKVYLYDTPHSLFVDKTEMDKYYKEFWVVKDKHCTYVFKSKEDARYYAIGAENVDTYSKDLRKSISNLSEGKMLIKRKCKRIETYYEDIIKDLNDNKLAPRNVILRCPLYNKVASLMPNMKFGKVNTILLLRLLKKTEIREQQLALNKVRNDIRIKTTELNELKMAKDVAPYKVISSPIL